MLDLSVLLIKIANQLHVPNLPGYLYIFILTNKFKSNGIPNKSNCIQNILPNVTLENKQFYIIWMVNKLLILCIRFNVIHPHPGEMVMKIYYTLKLTS